MTAPSASAGSGELDQELDRLMNEDRSERFWDEEGSAVDRRPLTFENVLSTQRY